MAVELKQLITASSMRCFKTCRRQFWYRYELGLRPTADSFALAYGIAFHSAVEILEKEGLDAAVEFCLGTKFNDAYTPHTLAAQIKAYDWRWKDEPLWEKTLEPEIVFQSELRNPETGRASMLFDLAGKKDAKGLLRDGRTALRETKTISEAPDSDRYWRRLLVDPQITLYYEHDQHTDNPAHTIIYDVCRKPCIAPYMATPIEKQKQKKDGSLYANQRLTDETPEEWQERLFADMCERPNFYLARREIPRLEQDVAEFRQETWEVQKDIRHAQQTNRWYRNAGRFTCDNCCYFNFCTGMELFEPDQPPPIGFQIVSNIHPELA